MDLIGGRWRLLIFWLLTLIAALEFIARGPARALSQSGRTFNDFLSPCVQTRAWLAGRDPYSPQVVAAMWPVLPRPTFVTKESLDGTLPAKRGLPSPYLPVAFPVLLPIALLPWKIAIVLWILVSIAALFTVTWGLIQLAGGDQDRRLAWMISLAVLLFAPVHTAMATSNIVTVVLALGIVATLCISQNRTMLAGISLAVAIALKPTVALPFAIYVLASRRRTRVIISAMAVGLLLAAVTVIPGHGAGLWWRSFLANDHAMFAPGAIDDFSAANPLAFQLVNLQVGLFPVLQDRTVTQALVLLLFAILLALWFRAFHRDGQLGLLDLGVFASVALLFIYHRFTDAGLLLLAVAWALCQLQGKLRNFAIICLALAVPFLIPGATVLEEFSGKYPAFEKLSRSPAWDMFILPHEAWLILAMCVVLVAARSWAARLFVLSQTK
ncbi:MAG TPA: glycosyltransferase family 87 protein [Terriglobales bacterium]|nr:glycosyltransferase family 87 protein [Terriglobales bacterium]